MNELAQNIMNNVYKMESFMLNKFKPDTKAEDKFDIMNKKVFFVVKNM